MTTQRRAKAGGEKGANGAWYEGGKFIATTDHEKSSRRTRKGTGRQEIEPYTYDLPPEPGMRSLYGAMSPGVFTSRDADGKWGLNPNTSEHTWAYYHDGDAEAVARSKDRYQNLADRFNAGERWIKPASPVVGANDSAAAISAKERFLSEHAEAATAQPDEPPSHERPRVRL